jgi:hypothetical protein
MRSSYGVLAAIFKAIAEMKAFPNFSLSISDKIVLVSTK